MPCFQQCSFPIRIYLLLLIAIPFTGCDDQYAAGQIKALSRNIETANYLVEDDNRVIYNRHNNNLVDPATKSMAEFWDPAIMTIQQLTKNAIDFTDGLKQRIKEMPEDKPDAVEELINRQGNTLYNRIAAFNRDIDTVFNYVLLTGDSLLSSQVRKDLITYKRDITLRFSSGRDSLPINKISSSKWLYENFSGATPVMAGAMLNKLQNDVLLTEQSLLTYINNMQAYDRLLYYSYMSIATLSSSVVKAGDSIEIRAGMGVFYDLDGLQITIDGKPVAVNQEHVVVYPIIAGKEPGKYTVPVTIQYQERNDKKVRIKESLKYTIVP